MRVKVVIPKLQGTVQAPPSKSFMQRVCALALLNRGSTLVRNPGVSQDDLAALDIIQSMGARIDYDQENHSLRIASDGCTQWSGMLNARESGLAARMFIPLAALSNQEVTITGEGTLLKRSMQWLMDVLPELNVQVNSLNGLLPMSVKGPLLPKSLTVDASQSSQYISGLIMALAYTTHEPVQLRLFNIVSLSYLQLTIRLMKHFGYVLDWNGENEIIIQPLQHCTENKQVEVDIEGDWSAAAALLVAGAIGGRISLAGLTYPSVQGDAAVLRVLQDAGAQVEILQNKITVSHAGTLQAFNYHAEHTPDVFPVLAVLALYAQGTSRISGVSRLWNKESNRANAVQALVKALGGTAEIREDVMHIRGPVSVNEVHMHSFHDHRIVMAAAIASAGSNTQVTIDDAQAVEKSYPHFFKDISKLGAQVLIT